MTWSIIIQILLFAIALSMDAFAVSVTDGLIYQDINKKKGAFIALTFGLLQGLMPLIGYWAIELIKFIVSNSLNNNQEVVNKAGQIMSWIVTIISSILLLIIGIKMLIEGISLLKKKPEKKPIKKFSYKEVLLMGIITAIDALAVGVSLNTGLSNNITIFLHVSIIAIITFILSLIGVLLGNKIEKILKGKIEISSIIGGSILITLAVWIIISHILGI